MGQTDMFNAEMHCSEVGSHHICISGGGGGVHGVHIQPTDYMYKVVFHS